MHEHIRKTVEDILNMISESLSLYKSINKSELQGMGPNTLISIIQSKENSLNSLLEEYNKIYPSFKPKEFPTISESVNSSYNRMLSIENNIASLVQNNLFHNIPSKGHDGIYTIGANIRSNSESTIVKLNNILNIKQRFPLTVDNFIKTLYPLKMCLETYEKEGLAPQVELCKSLLEKNRSYLRDFYNKDLLLYEPKYGETLTTIADKFKIKLKSLTLINNIKNPYEKILCKYLIIITT